MGGGRAYCRAAASLRNRVGPRPTLAVTKIYVACVAHPFPGGNNVLVRFIQSLCPCKIYVLVSQSHRKICKFEF